MRAYSQASGGDAGAVGECRGGVERGVVLAVHWSARSPGMLRTRPLSMRSSRAAMRARAYDATPARLSSSGTMATSSPTTTRDEDVRGEARDDGGDGDGDAPDARDEGRDAEERGGEGASGDVERGGDDEEFAGDVCGDDESCDELCAARRRIIGDGVRGGDGTAERGAASAAEMHSDVRASSSTPACNASATRPTRRSMGFLGVCCWRSAMNR